MTENNKVHESILVGKLLSLTAYAATSSMDKFSGWMLAGAGAALTLVLSNIDTVSSFVPLSDIKLGVILFLVALALGVMQRWFTTSILAGSMVSDKAEELGRNAPEEFDYNHVLLEMEKAILYPQKWLVQYQYNKVIAGDFAAPGRMQALLSQIQMYIVVIQTGFIVASLVVLVSGLNT
ncbi:hypothetical protein KUW19_10085 [Ferrimonas balearica]|uniref:hypothetical protein n=1 Tax=Ferrimonas balearica TaxID=44012 RepID=UPI001C953CC4|nr:hypothetical protein [Ferrimonas balearica]MBY6106822.1 hypothetical protein [Ferrimonas balearica]